MVYVPAVAVAGLNTPVLVLNAEVLGVIVQTPFVKLVVIVTASASGQSV